MFQKGFFVSLMGVLLAGQLAQADVWGAWNGTASFSDSDGYYTSCSTLSMQFEKSETTLSFNQYADCGDFTIDMNGSLEISGNDLVINGSKVGSISDTEVSFEGYTPQSGMSYSMWAKVNSEGVLDFKDEMQYSSKPGFHDNLQGMLLKGKRTQRLTRKHVK